jgi:hypothetical protein
LSCSKLRHFLFLSMLRPSSLLPALSRLQPWKLRSPKGGRKKSPRASFRTCLPSCLKAFVSSFGKAELEVEVVHHSGSPLLSCCCFFFSLNPLCPVLFFSLFCRQQTRVSYRGLVR